MAECNRHKVDKRSFLYQNLDAVSSFCFEEDVVEARRSVKSRSTVKIIRWNREILRNMICMVVNWSAASLSYYLIAYQLKYIKGDMFINGLVSSTSEIAAYILSGQLLSCISIQNLLRASFLLGVAGMLALL